MKLINIILAVYVLALSCIPCADEASEQNPNLAKVFIYSGNSHSGHNHENDSCELCSPFCICACCGGFTVAKTLPQLNPLTHFTNNEAQRFDYSSVSLSNYSSQFWHPPKRTI